jgi:hypothetical protein
MPQVLTMTQKPGESPEQFAARVSGQVTSFFGESTGAAAAPTDETAGTEPKEPAPSA